MEVPVGFRGVRIAQPAIPVIEVSAVEQQNPRPPRPGQISKDESLWWGNRDAPYQGFGRRYQNPAQLKGDRCRDQHSQPEPCDDNGLSAEEPLGSGVASLRLRNTACFSLGQATSSDAAEPPIQMGHA